MFDECCVFVFSFPNNKQLHQTCEHGSPRRLPSGWSVVRVDGHVGCCRQEHSCLSLWCIGEPRLWNISRRSSAQAASRCSYTECIFSVLSETGLWDPWPGTSFPQNQEGDAGSLLLLSCLLQKGSYLLYWHEKKSFSIVSSEHEWLKLIRIQEGTLQSC